MNHCVPDLEMDDHYSNVPTSSSGLTRPSKLSPQEDDTMELLWHNGHVVLQSQNQRSFLKKSPPPISKYDAVIPTDTEPRSSQLPREQESASHSQFHNQQHLFIEEDEMAAWLHYPLVDDQSFTADLFYPPPTINTSITTSNPPDPTTHNTGVRPPEVSTVRNSRPPLHPVRKEMDTKLQNFGGYFSRLKTGLVESGPSNVVRESTTVIDSSETPAKRRTTEEASNLAGTTSSGGGRGKDEMTCEMTATSSSPGGSSATAEPTPTEKPLVEDRKRKEREEDETDCQSEDAEFEYADVKKQVRATSSTKRSRAAEVHNLSERRRRDRINEKMKALQELIPRCNKSDKASMLDEAIEYLKSLQLQVQMMSMGCAMVPMMFPGVQQYMPPMGMGMGMGMEMGLNRPMIAFPNVLAGSALTTQAAANHLGPRFPIPAFHMPPASATEPSRMQARSQSDYMLNSFCTQNPNQPRIPNFADPYQQYIGSHQQAHWPLPQYQTMVQTTSNKPSTSRGAENHDNNQSG